MGIVEGVLLASTAVSAGASVLQSREASKSNRAARRAEAARAFRERTQAFRQARLQSAAVQNQAAAGGLGGSSGALGQVAAINTNTSSNVAFANQLDQLRQRQLDAQSRGQLYGAIGSVAGTIGAGALNFPTGAKTVTPVGVAPPTPIGVKVNPQGV